MACVAKLEQEGALHEIGDRLHVELLSVVVLRIDVQPIVHHGTCRRVDDQRESNHRPTVWTRSMSTKRNHAIPIRFQRLWRPACCCRIQDSLDHPCGGGAAWTHATCSSTMTCTEHGTCRQGACGLVVSSGRGALLRSGLRATARRTARWPLASAHLRVLANEEGHGHGDLEHNAYVMLKPTGCPGIVRV